MHYDNRIPAAQRGYRISGKKLAPRDHNDAMARDVYGAHSMRELNKLTALERAAYEKRYTQHDEDHPWDESPHWRRVEKMRAALPSRRRRAVDRILDTEMVFPAEVPRLFFCAGMNRYLSAAVDAMRIEKCIQADDLMLRNCY